MGYSKKGISFFIVLLVIALETRAHTEQMRFEGESSAPNDAVSFINLFVNNVLDLQKHYFNDEKSFRKELQKVILHYFDLDHIAQYSLGPYWDDLTTEQKADFTRKVKVFLIARYSKKITPRDDFTLKVSGAKANKNSLMVTSILQKNGEEYRVDFVLLSRNPSYAIVDVMAEEISLMRNYRSHFMKIIRTQSYEKLLMKLDESLKNQEVGTN